jgi:hypothetical protein
VIAAGSLSGGDVEGTLTARVQHFQIGDRASATGLEWDNGLNLPSIFFVHELTASRAFALLLLPESFWKAVSLQPFQHPHARAMREVGVTSRIEWAAVRFNSRVPDNPSI